MSEFKPSPFQLEIYEFVKHGQGSAIIEAVAGSGKTTVIINSLDFIPTDKKVIFLAFSKAIATELSARVPAFVNCKTLNAAGAGAFRNMVSNGGRAFFKLDAKKTAGIIDFMGINHSRGEIAKLVALGKSYGVAPRGLRGVQGVTKDTDEFWINLMERHDMDIPQYKQEAIIDHVVDVLKAGLQDTKTIDFDDQMYMPVVLGGTFEKYDWVFVDEAQDVSPVQRAMLRRMLRDDGRLVAVGDKFQAIFGFRGSDSQSLSNIALEFNAKRLPLSISYRCPQRVVKYAQKVVSHIEASPTAIKGSVQTWGDYTGKEFRPDDMIICRNTAPLVKLAYKLIGSQIPAKVLGRDIGTNLVKLIDKLKPKGVEGKDGLLSKLGDWKEKEEARLLKADKEDLIQGVEDKYDTLMAFINGTKASTVPKIKQAIEDLFGGNQKNAIPLCTVHKSKGLEAQRVFVLDDWMMPSKYARQDWQKEQENNLRYVAYTRAQRDLIFIDSEGIVSKKIKDINEITDPQKELAV